jgi:hypothetical protein
MTSTLTFLSSLQDGLSTVATLASGATHATLPLKADLGATTFTRTVRVKGSGELQSFPYEMISRRWPGTNGAARAGAFPFVELADPDFPWRYSSVRRTTLDTSRHSTVQVMPWLALVTLAEGEYEDVEPRADQSLRTIKVDPSRLPPAEDAWAWAHVQVPATAASVGSGELRNARARILSPRRLVAGTRYRAFLVPVFERGRLAGVLPPDDAISAPAAMLAWNTHATGTVELPWYDCFSFDAVPSHDFGTSARRLRPTTPPKHVGRKRFDASALVAALNVPAPLVAAARNLSLHGVLIPALADPKTWDATVDPKPFDLALTKFLNAPATSAGAAGGAPLVGPPLRGQWIAGADRVEGPSQPWFRELNVDLAARTWAAVGASVVRALQGELLASISQQVGRTATIAAAELTRQVLPVLQAKHLARQSVRVAASASLNGVVVDPTSRKSGSARLAATNAAPPLSSAAGRRVLRRAGALGKRAIRMGASLDPHAGIADVDFNPVVPPATQSASANSDLSPSGAFGIPEEVTVAMLRDAAGLNPLRGQPAGRGDSFDRRADAREEATGLPTQPKPEPWTTAALGKLLGGALDRAVEKAPTTSAAALPLTLESLLRRTASIPFVFGLEGLPHDSVSLWKVNGAAVAALLAGATDELGRELAWRGVRAGAGTYYFDRFWDSSRVADVRPPKSWTGALGQQVVGAQTILVFRSELFSQFPGTALYAVDNPSHPDPVRWPVLRGSLGDGLVFFGFSFSAAEAASKVFVLEAPVAEPWFGLPEDGNQKRVGWSDLPQAKAHIDLTRDRPSRQGAPAWPKQGRGTGAEMARMAWEPPVRITMPGSKLIGG